MHKNAERTRDAQELGLCCFVGDVLRSFCFGVEVVFDFCRNRKTWERTGDAFWSLETLSELIYGFCEMKNAKKMHRCITIILVRFCFVQNSKERPRDAFESMVWSVSGS